ncbi:ATP-dependent DNA helicase [Trichonephila inaurata madagascariensis]|uniref:ATP-dependent DNA helicase n=1 Tax=Trichonephila inaurata madagascariensis TaxID=2747483 RepID=A0A8X6XVA8_9ARAC|nr:ATP-dependent DNA helicase [Trichonephila inaurata madagascariensis]
MVMFLKILQQVSSLCHEVKLSTLLTNFCPRCILTFSKTSRIRTGFLNSILANRNDVVKKLNVTIQKQLPGQEYAYKSIDCIFNDDEAVQYPIEFLNSVQTPDLQAHNLTLKVGSPIMLIQNIDAPRLCNGTRLIAKKLIQHLFKPSTTGGF